MSQVNQETKIDAIAYKLLGILQDEEPHESGDMRRQLHITQTEFYVAIKYLRMCQEGHSENIIWKMIDQLGRNGRSRKVRVYLLTSDMDEASVWTRFTARQACTRFVTAAAIWRSFVHATDGRTARGRMARLVDRNIRRVVEDVTEFSAEWHRNVEDEPTSRNGR